MINLKGPRQSAPSRAEPSAPPRVLGPSPILLSFVALVVTALWLFRSHGGLGVRGKWVVEPNFAAWPWGAWPLPVGFLVIFGGAAALAAYDRFKRAKGRREQRASTRACIVALMMLGTFLPWTLLGPGAVKVTLSHFTLEGRLNIIGAMWSDVATQYFGAAYQITDARQFAREYTSVWQNSTSSSLAHIATHPPGAVLVFYGIRRFYEAVPGLDGVCSHLAATMTQTPFETLYASVSLLRSSASRSGGAPAPPVLPTSAVGCALFTAFLLGASLIAAAPALFGLASLGARSEEEGDIRGLMAVALFVLAPTLNLFAFTLDGLIAALVVWTLYGAARALQGSEPRWWFFTGALFTVTAFLTAGVLVVVPLVFIAAWFWKPGTAGLIGVAKGFGAGAAVCGLVLWLLFPANPIEVFVNAAEAHRLATLEFRPWLPWLGLNIVTWALFMGWPVTSALLARRPYRVVEWPCEAIGLATLIVIGLMQLSGDVRGETERLWLFLLAPLVALAVARLPWRVGVPLIVLQAVQTLIMSATLAPLVRPF